MPALRFNIKPTTCLPNVVCGDDIEALWGNMIRDNAQNAFERGETVVSLSGPNTGVVRIPLVGFCWNMIHRHGNNPDRDVRWVNGSDIRFQPAFPHYHHCTSLYVDNDITLVSPSNIYGGPVVDANGIEGKQYKLQLFENAGFEKVQVLATVRRGKRNVTTTDITANNSNISVFEFKEDDSQPLAYEQHIQCWYCRENPSGPSFPPLAWKIFDDTDCPVRVYTEVSKEISVTPPAVGQTEKDYLVIAVWYSAPHYSVPGFPPARGFESPNGYWVNNTEFMDIDSDGLLDIAVKLFKAC